MSKLNLELLNMLEKVCYNSKDQFYTFFIRLANKYDIRKIKIKCNYNNKKWELYK
jgi:hypothetical protein